MRQNWVENKLTICTCIELSEQKAKLLLNFLNDEFRNFHS